MNEWLQHLCLRVPSHYRFLFHSHGLMSCYPQLKKPSSVQNWNNRWYDLTLIETELLHTQISSFPTNLNKPHSCTPRNHWRQRGFTDDSIPATATIKKPHKGSWDFTRAQGSFIIWLVKKNLATSGAACIVGTSTAVLEQVAIIMHDIAQSKVIIVTAILLQIIYIVHLFGFVHGTLLCNKAIISKAPW